MKSDGTDRLVRREFVELLPTEVVYLSEVGERFYRNLFTRWGVLNPGEVLPVSREVFNQKMWVILDAQLGDIVQDLRNAPAAERAAGLWSGSKVVRAVLG